METLKKKTLSFPLKYFATVATSLAVMLAFSACGDKGGSNNGVPGYGVGIQCASCTGLTNPQILDSFSAQNGLGAMIFTNVQVFVQGQYGGYPGQIPGQGYPGGVYPGQVYPGTYPGGVYPGASYGSTSSYNLYSGPVALNGQVIATTQLVDPANRGCIIPPGSYQLITNSQGQLSMGFLQMPDMILNPGNIHLTIYQGMLYKGGATQSTRMYGSVYITSVNGVPCSNAFSDTFN